MRSLPEIGFRLKQEAMNLALYLMPPSPALKMAASPLPGLPDPEPVASGWRDTPYAAEVQRIAARVMAGEFEVLGHEAIRYGSPPLWRRDPANGIESGLKYFRLLPYLDPGKVGDQKLVWEVNRHAHLVILAQAALLSGGQSYVDEIERQLQDWWRQNPFQQGVNWTAALEVAFRAVSWMWVYHFAGARLSESCRRNLMVELYRHARHLEYNLSYYSSPNTHLLGEAVALHAAGCFFPEFPGAGRWRDRGRRAVRSHMETHVLDDGFYFEQSSYYHVYALDMFLFHAILEPVPESYRNRLERMVEITEGLAGPGRILPLLGDDDGGRWFHPYGQRKAFCRASMAAASRFLGRSGGDEDDEDHAAIGDWWLGPRGRTGRKDRRCQGMGSRHWKASGLVTMTSGARHVVFDGGAMGAGTAGHSHADALSLVVYDGGRELLHDPGTYCYLVDPAARNEFRSVGAHNTVKVEAREQAEPAGLFGWRTRPKVAVRNWESGELSDWLVAVCETASYRHTRQVLFLKGEDLLFVWDEVAALDPAGARWRIEQNWHTVVCETRSEEHGMPLGGGPKLWSLAGGERIRCEDSWQSSAYGRKEPGRVMRVEGWTGQEPLMAVVDWRGDRAVSLAPDGRIRAGNVSVGFHPGERPDWKLERGNS